MSSAAGEITRLLAQVSEGNGEAESRLAEAVYQQLHGIAIRCMRPERNDHTLQPTALVHEAFLKLVRPGSGKFTDRQHFFAVAARAMRRILIDHARKVRAEKRGRGAKVSLDGEIAITDAMSEELIALDRSLQRLAELDERQSRIVELRFFAGLSEEEIANLLGVSTRTIKREWKTARAWLHNSIAGRTS
jgi:RNA polymerase sigma-70 factor, ECF subfamily